MNVPTRPHNDCVHIVPGAMQAAAIEEPETKDALRANTQEAIAGGVFSAPGFFVGHELFWGNDRLDFVGEVLRA